MSWGFVHWGMLGGLAWISIPLIIHFLHRRRATVVDWGAMQFLELGRRSTWKLQLAEVLLLLGRMALLGLIALALSRPFWNPNESQAAAAALDEGRGGTDGGRRDVVLVIDGSSSMGRKSGQTSPQSLAIAWSKQFVSQLRPGDSVAVLIANDRVRRLVAPASFDTRKVEAALSSFPPPRGGCDLPLAIADGLRLLDAPGNPVRDVIVLTDGQRFAWRPQEPARWSFVRELHKEVTRRSGVAPWISSIAFGGEVDSELANASVGPLELSRGLITPSLPITVQTNVSNSGPGPITPTAELRIDGQRAPGITAMLGPIPAGGKVPLSFKVAIETPGSHVLSIGLTGSGDALPGDDESFRAIEVTAAVPVLLIDGEPGTEPLSGETDFLRAAVAPAGAETLQIKARTLRLAGFRAQDLKDQRVVVLANIERLDRDQTAAISRFLDAGGGVLVALGYRVDASFANSALYQGGEGWLPARLGARKGEPSGRQTIAHPSPQTFIGPALAPFGKGDNPPLAGADLFAYTVLHPAKDASTVARLDTGDPWIIERRFHRGGVAILAGAVDAEGGTLPANPDFVPWAHELIFHLADANSAGRNVQPGESIVLELDAAPAANIHSLQVIMPEGSRAEAIVTRTDDGRARAQFDETGEPGVYQFVLPDPAGGARFATVATDARESDLEPLRPTEATALADDWPLSFEAAPDRLANRLSAAGRSSGRREIWRYLVVATLVGLCMEIWLTRRLVKSRGIAALDNSLGGASGARTEMLRSDAR